MTPLALKFLIVPLFTLLSPSSPVPAVAPPADSIVWDLATLDTLTAPWLERAGAPLVIPTSSGNAVLFDGVQDGFFLSADPLKGLPQFTVEIVFRPDPGGASAQRFLHMGEMNRDRIMLETRLTPDDRWYLDAHLRSGDSARTLIDSTKLHPTGEWYHAAFVVDRGAMRVYLNGRLELEGALPFAPLKGGSTSIGVRQNRRYWFKGAIRTVRVTPTCVTPSAFLK